MASQISGKKVWRCKVCGDIHIGVNFPSPCPTCGHKDSYVEMTLTELKKWLK